MEYIDEDGRLFGYVNVVDVLVVLLLVAVLLAGVTLVTGGSTEEDPEMKRVEVTFNGVPASTAATVQSGDTFAATVSEEQFGGEVLDVYVTPNGGDTVSVSILVNAPQSTRLGEFLVVRTADYQLNGTVSRRYSNRTTLQTEDAYATVETTVAPGIVESIEVGDTYREGNRTVAQVVGMETIPTPGDRSRDVRLLLRVSAKRSENGLRFAGRPLSLGRYLRFDTTRYRLNGTIVDVGNRTLGLGRETTTIAVDRNVSREAARAMAVGDEYVVDGQTVATIRAIDRIPTLDRETTKVRLVLALQTMRSDGTEMYLGEPIQFGRTIRFDTDDYRLNARIVDVGNATTGVSTERMGVVTDATLPVRVLESLDVGDRYVVDGQRVATIRSLDTVATTGKGTVRVRLGLDLRTFAVDGERRFLGTQIRPGARIPFETDAGFTFDSQIVFTNTTDTGVSKRERKVLTTLVVPTSTADSIDVGDTFRRLGERLAVVESVETFPTSDPARRRVQIGLRLQVATVQPDNETRYLGTELRPGRSIEFVTDDYAITPTVLTVGSFDLPGERSTVTVDLHVTNVPPTVADDLETGMTIRRDGTVVARVTGVSVEPADVIVRSQDGQIYRRDHPINKDVTLTVELAARETRSGLWYNDRPLRVGDSVILDFQDVAVEGEVGSIRR